MSRQSHLPPRCPFQKQPVSRPIHESYLQHHKSASQSSILEEQPAWLDDLLSDQDADSKGIFHRRSASDSVTLLDGLVDSFSGLNSHNNEDSSVENGSCSRLESASMYGPNSPRQRGNVTFSENAMASALSEYVYQNPLQYVDGSLCISRINHADSKRDVCGSVGEPNCETQTAKRLEPETLLFNCFVDFVSIVAVIIAALSITSFKQFHRMQALAFSFWVFNF